MKFPICVFCLIIGLFGSAQSHAQTMSPRMKALYDKLLLFNQNQQFDSIAFYSDAFMLNSDLNNFEQQFINYHKALLYQKINRVDDAIITLKKSISFATTEKKSVRLNEFCTYLISDLYFTKKKYKDAFENAQKVVDKKFIEDSPSSGIIINSIIGYYYFLNLEYDKSQQSYERAVKLGSKTERCNLPIVYVKIAKIFSRQNKFLEAKKIIQKSISISDSCKQTINTINANKALREILIENGKFEEASKIDTNIDNLGGDVNAEIRNKKIDSLETVFKTKLKEEQNKSLTKVNSQKSKQIEIQKWILIGTSVGILLLLTLLFFVFKLSRKQKKLNQILSIQKLEIEKSNNNLERLNLLNQKIFSVISHDFRAPMVNLELLLKTELDSSNFETLLNRQKNIANNLNQANQIMTNLMSWSKRELGFVTEKSNQTNAYQAIAQVCLQLDNFLKQKNIEIINDVSSDVNIKIADDIFLIIFRNIINNALKFSYPENDIVISFNAVANEFSIHDFGIGMTESQIQNLFSANIISKPGTNQEAGFGIGLQFVHELMLQNNGKIRIESVLNEGTIVFLKFQI